MATTQSGLRTLAEPIPLSDAERKDLFEHLLSRQLRRILRLVDLEVSGDAVQPDTFEVGAACGAADSERPPVKYEAILSYTRNESRLDLIRDGLRRALSLGVFTRGGEALPVDGFRLRDLAQWSNYPVASLDDNVGSISSYCNCDCEFCYEKGTRGAGITLGRAQLTLQEVETRIRYYSSDKRTGLLPSGRFSLEPFVNPNCLTILERIHDAAPDDVTNITTNGSFLTEDIIARLAQLRPIVVTVSMNAGSVEMRERSMRDGKPGGDETALASLPLLRRHEIPFVGSYVPWPSKPLSDMEDMIRLVDANDGMVVRVCMPSWTNSSPQHNPFDTQQYWSEILEVVQRLRSEVQVPIHMMPNMYQLRTMLPVVQGTIKNSPAAQAGMKYGDLIVAIDGERVYTRPEVARFLAVRFDDPKITSTRFTMQRDGEVSEITVPNVRDPDQLKYPYNWAVRPGFHPRWLSSLGIHLADGLELKAFVRLKEIVEEYPGKNVLFYISDMAEPHFYEGMEMLGEMAEFMDCCEFYVEKLWPRYWGGNVVMGDLWTFQDLTEQTRSWIERTNITPDVVITPHSFLSEGGRDLVGDCYLDFERALDIELRLLPCHRIGI